jgi:hypothetical protein
MGVNINQPLVNDLKPVNNEQNSVTVGPDDGGRWWEGHDGPVAGQVRRTGGVQRTNLPYIQLPIQRGTPE